MPCAADRTSFGTLPSLGNHGPGHLAVGCGVGAIFSDRYRALLRDMQKLFFLFLFLFKKAFACPKPLGRGF